MILNCVCELNLILLEIDAMIDCVHYTKTHPDDCEVNDVHNNCLVLRNHYSAIVSNFYFKYIVWF